MSDGDRSNCPVGRANGSGCAFFPVSHENVVSQFSAEESLSWCSASATVRDIGRDGRIGGKRVGLGFTRYKDVSSTSVEYSQNPLTSRTCLMVVSAWSSLPLQCLYRWDCFLHPDQPKPNATRIYLTRPRLRMIHNFSTACGQTSPSKRLGK